MGVSGVRRRKRGEYRATAKDRTKADSNSAQRFFFPSHFTGWSSTRAPRYEFALSSSSSGVLSSYPSTRQSMRPYPASLRTTHATTAAPASTNDEDVVAADVLLLFPVACYGSRWRVRDGVSLLYHAASGMNELEFVGSGVSKALERLNSERRSTPRADGAATSEVAGVRSYTPAGHAHSQGCLERSSGSSDSDSASG